MTFESEKDNLNTFNIKLAGKDPALWQATLKAMKKNGVSFIRPGLFRTNFMMKRLKECMRGSGVCQSS